MTDYSNGRAAWKKREVRRRGRELLSVFIVIVLVFAILNGLVKTFSIKKYLGKSTWDSKSSFVAALGTNPPAVFVFQKEPKRIVVFNLDANKYYYSGNSDEPLVKLSSVVDKKETSEFVKILSLSFGADIKNYVLFNNQNLDQWAVEESFKNFASITTPIKLLMGKTSGDIMDTNIARSDLIKLWWQSKSIGINKIEIVDLTPFSQEVVTNNNRKVLGVDDASLHFKISPYLENHSLGEDELKVVLENASGVVAASNFASQIVASIGFTVATINSSDNQIAKTKIVTTDEDSYAANYLANIFDGDIVFVPNSDPGQFKQSEAKEIKVIIGKDFTGKYFR